MDLPGSYLVSLMDIIIGKILVNPPMCPAKSFLFFFFLTYKFASTSTSGAQAREARQRSTMGKIFLGNLSMREILLMTSAYVRPPVQIAKSIYYVLVKRNLCTMD